MEKQNNQKDLILVERELAFQNEEKEKRAAELVIANNALLCVVKPPDFDNCSKTITDLGFYWLVVNNTPKQ